jgi:hypothetical protein
MNSSFVRARLILFWKRPVTEDPEDGEDQRERGGAKDQEEEEEKGEEEFFKEIIKFTE